MRDLSTRLQNLLPRIRELILAARHTAVRAVDSLQVFTNFEIGRMIVEQEQQGEKRARYGKGLLKELAARLNDEFGRGFSEDNLSLMRRFYLIYQDPRQISATMSRKCLSIENSQELPGLMEKSETASRISALTGTSQTNSGLFSLSWSHYVFLMGIKDAGERSFYEIEATSQNWSLRELRRQFDSGLYERLALSRDKKGVRELSKQGQRITKSEEMIKNPYVLEFLGLREETRYSEREMETAIIDKLEHFLLEMGKGFLFEARQKRFTFEDNHFFVDLVFYNRLLLKSFLGELGYE